MLKVKKWILWLCVSIPSGLFAQGAMDSIYTFLPVRETVLENFLHHHLSHQESFGTVHLDYEHQTGDLHKPMEPHRSNRINFYTVGANRINDIVISGDFLFNKEFDDSLSYGLKNNLDHWNPFQYYAGKANTFERQNYRANVTVSYQRPWLIQPFINVHYLYHWTTSSVDPRVESKKFLIKYSPGIMHCGDDYAVAFKGIIGRGHERISLDFKNTEFRHSLLFPERIHYLNFGYGHNAIKDTSSMAKYDRWLGGELSVHKSFGKHQLDLTGSFQQKRQENATDMKSNKHYYVRSRYVQNQVDFRALFHYFGRNHLHKIRWKSELIDGYDGMVDFSPDLSSVNYEVNVQRHQLQYDFAGLRPIPRGFQSGLDVSMASIQRRDHAMFIDVQNSFASLAPYGQVQFGNHQQPHGLVRMRLQPHYRFPISDELRYSENSMNSFVENVVFRDYNYYRMAIFGVDLGIEWMNQTWFPTMLISFKLDGFSTWQLSEHHALTKLPVNNWKRQGVKMGFNLYL